MVRRRLGRRRLWVKQRFRCPGHQNIVTFAQGHGAVQIPAGHTGHPAVLLVAIELEMGNVDATATVATGQLGPQQEKLPHRLEGLVTQARKGGFFAVDIFAVDKLNLIAISLLPFLQQ